MFATTIGQLSQLFGRERTLLGERRWGVRRLSHDLQRT